MIVFPLRRPVAKYHAIDGRRQTLGNLAAYVERPHERTSHPKAGT